MLHRSKLQLPTAQTSHNLLVYIDVGLGTVCAPACKRHARKPLPPVDNVVLYDPTRS